MISRASYGELSTPGTVIRSFFLKVEVHSTYLDVSLSIETRSTPDS